MNTVVKVAILMIMLNLASGIILIGVLDTDGNPIFDESNMGGMRYQENYGSNVTQIDVLQEPINPAGTAVEDAGDRVYRVLDMMSLGFIYRWIDAIRDLMFGFIELLDAVIGPWLAEDLRSFLFGKTIGGQEYNGLFHFVLTLGYIIAGIQLFTGKNITGED